MKTAVHPHDASLQSCLHLFPLHPEKIGGSSGTFPGMQAYKGAKEVRIGVLTFALWQRAGC